MASEKLWRRAAKSTPAGTRPGDLLSWRDAGATTSAMQAEVHQAFRAIDVPEDKALKAAEAEAAFDDRDRGLGQVGADIGALRTELRETRHLVEGTRSELRDLREVAAPKDASASLAAKAARKTDLDALATKADLDTLRAESKADIGAVELDLAAVEGDVAWLKWMMGFVLAAEIPMPFKLFGP